MNGLMRSQLSRLTCSETTAWGTGHVKTAGKEDPFEVDSNKRFVEKNKFGSRYVALFWDFLKAMLFGIGERGTFKDSLTIMKHPNLYLFSTKIVEIK